MESDPVGESDSLLQTPPEVRSTARNDDTPKVNRMRDAVVLGIAFLLLFSAFTVVQNLATSVFDESAGFWALGTLYICFSFSNLAASSVVKALGLRLSLFLGGSTYIVYVVANVISVAYEGNTTLHYALLVPTAALLGVGAATLWTAQGAYLTFCADDSTLGLYSGIFFTIFISNQVIGNVGAAVLLDQGVNTDIVFIILAVVGTCGLFVFGLLRPLSPPAPKNINTDLRKRSDLLEVVYLMADFRAAMLAMTLVYSGLTQSFFFGSLPLFIKDYSPGTILDLSMKLYLMGVFGVSDAVGSMLVGKVSDIMGRIPVLLFGCVTHLAGLIVLLTMDSVNQLQILIPVAILFGLGDAVFNTQIYGILGYVFQGSSEAAFASFKFYQAASTGVVFFLGKAMLIEDPDNPENKFPNMNIWFPVLVVPMVLGMLGIFFLRFKGVPVDAKSQRKGLQQERS